jgi:hypothetical protein
MKYFLFFILIGAGIFPLQSQSSGTKLTGSLYVDSKILFEENALETHPHLLLQMDNRKSPMLAGLFSLVLPGAGELYAGSYLKAAIFIAVEAAVITTALIYDKKGDDQTEKFENFADENWSVIKYAEWLNQYRNGNIQINPDENLPPWQRVSWSELNAAEEGFSHKLPPYGDQQYYELIGKYPQYSSGWNDFTGGEVYHQISPNFIFYSGERGKANDFYSVASTAVIGIYINHFLSALDAVWTTVRYNNSLAFKIRMEQINIADRSELIPTLKLSYNF